MSNFNIRTRKRTPESFLNIITYVYYFGRLVTFLRFYVNCGLYEKIEFGFSNSLYSNLNYMYNLSVLIVPFYI